MTNEGQWTVDEVIEEKMLGKKGSRETQCIGMLDELIENNTHEAMKRSAKDWWGWTISTPRTSRG